jgi:hypothetical protein
MANPTAAERADMADRAEGYYETQLKDKLEATARDQYVAIVADTGYYYLAGTIEEAAAAARQAHPDKYPLVLWVGHPATIFA